MIEVYMNKTFFRIGLGVLALAGMVWPSQAEVTGMKTLAGHVPPAVSSLAPNGRLAATNNLQLSIGLPLRNREALTNLLRQISDPANASYRHYLTTEEFRDQFGPMTNEYEAVLNFARANGLTVTGIHSNRMLVTVTGKVSDVEKAFHVKMMTYQHPTESRNFYAPDGEPVIDANLPILSVQGLNNYVRPHPMIYKRPANISQPSTGSGPSGGYIGNDYRNAYVPGSTLNGANQIVGLLQFDGYYPSDIQTYEKMAGLTNVPLQNVLLDSFDGSAGVNNDEVCMDIEMVVSMAPALAKVMVFEAGPYGNPDDILIAMAENSQIKQLSSSWGYSTDPLTEELYLELALQGQTYLNCSGDGDAWVGPILYGSVEGTFETIVGGTTLTMNGAGTSYASERVWNWGFNYDYGWNPDGYAGSSGGISTDVTIPYYQVNINMTTNQGSTSFRNVPDVALTADNIFVVSSGGSEGIFGGTSAATPLWAGFMALANQQAAANNRPSVGFLAPLVYGLANTTNYATCFHDIVAGNNTWDQSPANFFAVPGYDLCTGVGTPAGTPLINVLTGTNGIPPAAATPVIPAPKQPWGSTLSVLNGSDPNGLWMLFFADNSLNGLSGTNYTGWMVNLTTANPVGFAADNQLFINATNISLAPGSQWTTTLAVTNYGPSTSTNVVVTDTLPIPAGATLLSDSSSLPASTVNVAGTTLTWNVGVLPVNTGGTLTLNFKAVSTGVYSNLATVSALTSDPNPDDDSVAVMVTSAITTPPTIAPHFMAPGAGGGLQLSVLNDSGASVIIQASTNLVTWVPVATNIAPFVFTNFDTTNFQKRFYRAVIPQP